MIVPESQGETGDREVSASGNTNRVRKVKERGERYLRKGGKDGGMVSNALFFLHSKRP